MTSLAYPMFHELGPSDVPMAMTDADFAERYPAESELIEFKQGFSEVKIKEAVAAFSNSDGGVILIGVRDDGVVQGVAADGEAIARLNRIAADVRSPGRYSVHSVLVGERSILALAVARRREGFAQLNDGRILVRRGAMNAALFESDLARFISGRALTRFESTPLDRQFSDADPALVERLRVAYGWADRELPARLGEVGMLEGAGARSRLTVAGALFLLPDASDVLGKAHVEVFRYRDESDTYDRRFTVAGPLSHQVEATTQALMDELGSDVVVVGVHRYELPRIPEPVLREAIANAVAHRTYEASGQGVRVEIRPGRVQVSSPGGLPEPVTVANMRDQNAARNLHVIQALRRFRLAEDAGRGIDVMEDTMEAAMLERPEFGADDRHVRVVLRIGSAVTPQERAWLLEVEQRGEIRTQDKVVLLHAVRGELLTNGTVRQLLSVDSVHSRATLQRLRDLGFLTQSGSRGGVTYTLTRDLAPPAGLRLEPAELLDLVRSMADAAPVTNESVRERTGLDRAQVLARLNELVESGALERHGERRGTYYTRPGAEVPERHVRR